MRFQNHLNERAYDLKVFQVMRGGEIWFAYGQGSGSTVSIRSGFISDKLGDASYNTAITDFIKYADNNKPLKANKDKSIKMYALPVYQTYKQETFDIWGGQTKPSQTRYFIVTQGVVNVVNFFETKGEALAWIKHSV